MSKEMIEQARELAKGRQEYEASVLRGLADALEEAYRFKELYGDAIQHLGHIGMLVGQDEPPGIHAQVTAALDTLVDLESKAQRAWIEGRNLSPGEVEGPIKRTDLLDHYCKPVDEGDGQ